MFCEVVIVVYDYVFSGVFPRGEERRRRSWGPSSVIISLCLHLDLYSRISISYCYILFEIAYLSYRIVFVYAYLVVVLSYHIFVRLHINSITLCLFVYTYLISTLSHHIEIVFAYSYCLLTYIHCSYCVRIIL